MTLDINTIYHGDCLDLMKDIPDKSIDLVLTDPPYGIGDKFVGGCKTPNRMQELYNISNWVDVAPDQKYFDEIFRVSKNQIICGGNYFDLPPTRGFIVWDKIKHASNYSHAEYLWTSFDMVSKIFRFCSNGGFVINKQNAKLHPTQKPIELMEFCLQLCSEEGQTIFDPFLGSGTTAVACINTGRNYIGIEKDEEYFNIAQKRVKEAQGQSKLEVYIFK
jgi:site-specific DNA-methyltransferase (adenine-specific)